MKYLGISTIVCVALASQAAALSCIRPNLARSFNGYQQASETYVMGLGVLIAKGVVPEYVRGQPNKIPAWFKGVLLGSVDQSAEQTISVVVETTCLSVWCGGFPKTDKKMVAFLQKTSTGYRLSSNPCGGSFKVSPTSKEIRVLKKCLKEGKCSEAQIRSLDAVQ